MESDAALQCYINARPARQGYSPWTRPLAVEFLDHEYVLTHQAGLSASAVRRAGSMSSGSCTSSTGVRGRLPEQCAKTASNSTSSVAHSSYVCEYVPPPDNRLDRASSKVRLQQVKTCHRAKLRSTVPKVPPGAEWSPGSAVSMLIRCNTGDFKEMRRLQVLGI